MHVEKVWLLTSVITVLSGVLAWLGKKVADNLAGKLDEIVKELKNIELASLGLSKDVKTLQEKISDHESRIRYLEQNK